MSKKYKFIGDPDDYDNIKIGEIFDEKEVPKEWVTTVGDEAKYYSEDWEEIKEEATLGVKDNNFEEDVTEILDELKELLISKNKKYGDSAINPIRVFSNASNIEQIKVRLDDKLSRLRTQHIEEDEDVLNDLIGYLVLLKIKLKRND